MPVSALVEILDQQLGLAAEDAALGVDLIDRQLAADLLVLAELGIGAGQRIVEAELDLVRGPRGDDEGCGKLGDAGRSGRLDDAAAVEFRQKGSAGHDHPPVYGGFGQFAGGPPHRPAGRVYTPNGLACRLLRLVSGCRAPHYG